MFSLVKYPPPIEAHPTPEHFDEFKTTLSKVALTKVTVFSRQTVFRKRFVMILFYIILCKNCALIVAQPYH